MERRAGRAISTGEEWSRTLRRGRPAALAPVLRFAGWLAVGLLAAFISAATAAAGSWSPLAGGGAHTLVLRDGGAVWASGSNPNGELGDGTGTQQSTPVPVKGPGGTGVLTEAMAVATGTFHSLALLRDTTIRAWGDNRYGQLGDGSTDDRWTPVQVVGPGGGGVLAGVVAIAAGLYHSLALLSDGTVWAWGWNEYGQLGDGTIVRRTTPEQVKGSDGSDFLTNVVGIAAGGNYSLALLRDGTVRGWGDNGSGQLGDGTTTHRAMPVQVKGPGGSSMLDGVIALAAGASHSLAARADGTVWGWGANADGRLGDGTTSERRTPAWMHVESSAPPTAASVPSAGHP